ncbi:transposase [aff. Roholtiella sp. LEGE 12411]|nr:transposase [aff. Roholtiella sp. LEGE 12411]
MMALDQIHLFESRQEAFSDDEVLQETIIIHALKQTKKIDNVHISTSSSANDDFILSNLLPYREIVHPNDSQQFIHIIPDTLSQQVIRQMANFTYTLKDLGLTVSTGRVVDFRAKEYLCLMPEENTVPLIYPYLSIREWRCSGCQSINGRDENAALNIQMVGASTIGLGDVSRALPAIAV